jgi:iron complex transport system substrate-binding protein
VIVPRDTVLRRSNLKKFQRFKQTLVTTMRIVSLLPSATEIVCQLGLEKQLVGISHECDFPASVKNLPRLTSSSVNHLAPSRDIHQSVSDILKTSISVYDLDLEQLKNLDPDFIITQDLCDVCAVSFQQVQQACEQELGEKTQIISLKPCWLNDIWSDLERVAKDLGAEGSYRSFKDQVDRKIEAIRKAIPDDPAFNKKILTVEWLDPVFVGGMWVPEMIEIVGGTYLLAEPGQKARQVTKEDLNAVEPDVMIFKPCGFKLEQTLPEMDLIKNIFPWEKWPAWENSRVVVVDGNAYFNRPGPRIIDSLEILAYCAHPELFPEFGKKYESSIIEVEPDFNFPPQN